MIDRASIMTWNEQAPWTEPAMVEQDLIICKALVCIFSDEFKGGFFTGQEDRSAAIARTMLSQGWDVPFVAKMVMLDVEVVEVIKSLMEDRRHSEQM